VSFVEQNAVARMSGAKSGNKPDAAPDFAFAHPGYRLLHTGAVM
jgi:hypothetical protein